MVSSSLATCCDVQVANPLTVPTAGPMALNPAISERGWGDVCGSVGELLQSKHVARVTTKSGWTCPFCQNTVMTRGPLACERIEDFR